MQTQIEIPNYNVRLVGDAEAGKSALKQRLTEGAFTAEPLSEFNVFGFSFKGLGFDIKKIKVAGQEIRLTILDSSDPISYSTYYSDDAVAFIFDITNKVSFEYIKKYMKDVELYIECYPHQHKPHFILIGTKSDLVDERVVTQKEAQVFADECKMTYVEVSAKTGVGVHHAFVTCATELLRFAPSQQQAERKQEVTPTLLSEEEMTYDPESFIGAAELDAIWAKLAETWGVRTVQQLVVFRNVEQLRIAYEQFTKFKRALNRKLEPADRVFFRRPIEEDLFLSTRACCLSRVADRLNVTQLEQMLEVEALRQSVESEIAPQLKAISLLSKEQIEAQLVELDALRKRFHEIQSAAKDITDKSRYASRFFDSKPFTEASRYLQIIQNTLNAGDYAPLFKFLAEARGKLKTACEVKESDGAEAALISLKKRSTEILEEQRIINAESSDFRSYYKVNSDFDRDKAQYDQEVSVCLQSINSLEKSLQDKFADNKGSDLCDDAEVLCRLWSVETIQQLMHLGQIERLTEALGKLEAVKQKLGDAWARGSIGQRRDGMLKHINYILDTTRLPEILHMLEVINIEAASYRTRAAQLNAKCVELREQTREFTEEELSKMLQESSLRLENLAHQAPVGFAKLMAEYKINATRELSARNEASDALVKAMQETRFLCNKALALLKEPALAVTNVFSIESPSPAAPTGVFSAVTTFFSRGQPSSTQNVSLGRHNNT